MRVRVRIGIRVRVLRRVSHMQAAAVAHRRPTATLRSAAASMQRAAGLTRLRLGRRKSVQAVYLPTDAVHFRASQNQVIVG